ncbi:MAG: SDR family oxidoreductase [bacterium]|nr:SDR family oxidoreductase [bacterium]
MSGRYCVVTGASSGIGQVTALELAKMGAYVILVCRDKARGELAREMIRRESGSNSVDLFLADLSSQASIWKLAAELKGRFPRLHVLVNNAGAIFPERRLNAEGLEMTFALNHIAYFLLSNLLLDVMKDSPSRIINVASRAHVRGKINLEDLQAERGWSPMGSYAASKLANILFTREFARRLRGSKVTVNCLHPGVVASRFGSSGPVGMRLVYKLLRPILLSNERGADTVIHLASSPEVEGVSGEYFVGRIEKAPSRRARNGEAASGLWKASAAITRVG